ncbi:MAG: flagellar biosynthesis protein FlhA [Pseudomonadota bacterium]
MPSFSIKDLFQPTVLTALALMAIIVMMILPIPAWLLDVGLTASFSLAILLFTVTLFIERPLDFSAFPTVLLASLLLRLALNVSSTKLIIGQGHTGAEAAGGVINGFAMFVMGGNIFLGLVIFLVLLIVNFMVITKGAGRMAEVGARFALDGMPGKQLAIDADVAAGAITHEEAKERRRIEQEETTFFGSLDGASKFVKGDAIAGLLITLLNLIMGLAMGVGAHNLSFEQAVTTYSILTVGDGLVSQIPSVITSIAAGLLLSKGGVSGAVDKAAIAQLGAHPTALATVAGLSGIFGLMPGLPFVPFMGAAGLLGTAAYYQFKEKERARTLALDEPPPVEIEEESTLGDLLDLDEIHVEFSPTLIGPLLQGEEGLDARIEKIRKHVATSFGFVLPGVRLTDNPALEPGEYAVRIHGVKVASNRVVPGKVLVLLRDDLPLDIPGEDVQEPVYGAPARWVDEARNEEAALMGASVITPVEVLATHLLETVKGNFTRLLTRRALRRILDAVVTASDPARAEENRKLLDEYIPDKTPIDMVQSVLRLLLEERVSIRNLPLILEAISEVRDRMASPEQIVEHVRQRLGFQITETLKDGEGALPLIQLGPEWEKLFNEHETMTDDGRTTISLPPTEFNRLASSVRDKLNDAAAKGSYPVIVTGASRRRFLHTILNAKGVRNPVLSFEELGNDVRPSLVGVA